jgi:hypothetical protein
MSSRREHYNQHDSGWWIGTGAMAAAAPHQTFVVSSLVA